MHLKNFTFIDLFAGAGVLSEGFIRAGFGPVTHEELDSTSSYKIRTRTVYHGLLNNSQTVGYCSIPTGGHRKNEIFIFTNLQILKA